MEKPLYEILDPSTHSIRLLVLHHDLCPAPLRCSLMTALLDAAPNYFALSYAWGGAELTGSMVINGYMVSVTENLEAAIRRIRRVVEDVIVWVDAICINQADSAEKSHQIRNMRRIYQKAHCVIVWLGEQGLQSDLAIDLAQGLNKANIHALAMDPTELKTWKGLMSIFQRSWWKRVWVIQEVVCSNSILLLCGHKAIEWERFKAATVSIHHYLRGPQHIESEIPGFGAEPGFNSLLLMENLRLAKKNIEVRSLMQLLCMTRGREATDARDKVYALLGIGGDIPPIIQPDYSKSTEHVYAAVAKSYIQRSHALSIMRLCQNPRRVPDLPSWAPDWSISSLQLALQGFPHSRVSNASGGRPSRAEFSEDLKHLTVFGLRWDVVEEVGEAMGGDHEIATVVRWEDIVRRRASLAPHPYISEAGVFDAFWRSIIANMTDDDKHPAPPDFAERYASLIPFELKQHERPRDRESLKQYLDYHRPFRRPLINMSSYRRLIMTARNFVGIAPGHTQVGDVVCVLLGGEVPFMLRDEGPYWQLIGEAYVHGIMNGEAMEESTCGEEANMESFVLA